MLCCISHITLLPVVTCVMNVRDQMRPNVFHKLLSISLPPEQVCSQTTECQVYQYVPNIDFSEQFVSKQQIILQLIHFFLWVDDHPCMASRLCFIAQLIYWQVRNIFPRISLHDLPCQRTMKISFSGIKFLRGFSFWQFFCSPSRNP